MKVVDVRATLGPVFALYVRTRKYACVSCGAEQNRTTNHTSTLHMERCRCGNANDYKELYYVGGVPAEGEFNKEILFKYGGDPSWSNVFVIENDAREEVPDESC